MPSSAGTARAPEITKDLLERLFLSEGQTAEQLRKFTAINEAGKSLAQTLLSTMPQSSELTALVYSIRNICGAATVIIKGSNGG